MEIIHNLPKEAIKKIVIEKAKFQKVMMLYDDLVSNIEISEIYNSIKEFCIYNHSHIEKITQEELNDGYKIVIFMCGADNLLKFNFSKNEFINIFCPKDSAILPCYLSENNQIESDGNFLILNSARVDVPLISSVCFNEFFNYFNDLLNLNRKKDFSPLVLHEMSHKLAVEYLDNMDQNMCFLDMKIIKSQNISYSETVLVDLVLIDAISILIDSIKNQTVTLVDVYKVAKEDCDLIDKFYKFFNDETFVNIILLNYNSLKAYCLKAKSKILDCLAVYNFTKADVDKIIEKVKLYSKTNNGFMGYFYFYNLFGM